MLDCSEGGAVLSRVALVGGLAGIEINKNQPFGFESVRIFGLYLVAGSPSIKDPACTVK